LNTPVPGGINTVAPGSWGRIRNSSLGQGFTSLYYSLVGYSCWRGGGRWRQRRPNTFERRDLAMIRGVGNSKGFTLVEIMMVVIIIGILAVLAIPRYEKYTLESKLSEVNVAVGEIKTGMEKYYNSHGQRYTTIKTDKGLTYLQQVLRIDLGDMKNFDFEISEDTSATAGYTGYRVAAYLNQTGGSRDYKSDYVGRGIYFYFPKDLHGDWTKDNWAKGWNDDEFFQ
jgi:prepilin-type N-terminal cleavage/methylation domain-containing protein